MNQPPNQKLGRLQQQQHERFTTRSFRGHRRRKRNRNVYDGSNTGINQPGKPSLPAPSPQNVIYALHFVSLSTMD